MKNQNLKSNKKYGKFTNISNNNKGITLIALVITIIVLLILAGITIMSVTGENGILKRTSEAAKTHIVAEEKEKIRLAFLDLLASDMVDGNTITIEELKKEFAEGEVNIVKCDSEGNEITTGATIKLADIATSDSNTANNEQYVKITFIKTGNWYVTNMKSGKIVVSKEGEGKKEPTEPENQEVVANEITIDKTEIKLQRLSDQAEEPTTKITASVGPENAANKEIEWSSSNDSIATVDNDGNVTWKGIGKTTITAKLKANEEITKSCEIINSLKIVATEDGWDIKSTGNTTSMIEKSTERLEYGIAVKSTGGNGTYYTGMSREVDLTNVSTISGTIFSANDTKANEELCYIGISNSAEPNGEFENGYVEKYNGPGSGVKANNFSMDVSKLTGNHYIKIVAEHPNMNSNTTLIGYSGNTGILLEP